MRSLSFHLSKHRRSQRARAICHYHFRICGRSDINTTAFVLHSFLLFRWNEISGFWSERQRAPWEWAMGASLSDIKNQSPKPPPVAVEIWRAKVGNGSTKKPPERLLGRFWAKGGNRNSSPFKPLRHRWKRIGGVIGVFTTGVAASERNYWWWMLWIMH